MFRITLMVLFSWMAVSVYAADQEFKHFSIAVNAVPSLQNSTNTNVPGENLISNHAYQYQINFINQPISKKAGPFNQEVDYVSLRAFAYKNAYTDPSESSAFADGVSRIDGFALLYGQRYLLSDSGYQGFGFGWYAGFAMINDTYVQKGYNATPKTEKKAIPVVAAELFYKFDVMENFYVEPGITAAYDNSGGGVGVDFVPALIVGGQF